MNGYQTLFGVLKYIQNKKNYKKIPPKLPMFFIAGKEDPVGNYGDGVLKVVEQYKQCGIKNIKIKLYENDRHELTNEVDRDVIFEDIFGWLQIYMA